MTTPIKKNFTAEEKLALQYDLIQMAVHDLKGPLMEIISNIDLVVNSRNIPDDERDFAQTAMNGCHDLYNMVADMLDLGKLEAGVVMLDKSTVDLGALTEKQVRFFGAGADEREVTMTFKTDGDVTVMADERLLGRVIANLLSNGLKFSLPNTELQVSVKDEGSGVTVLVKDQGPGIPDDYRESIFEKYVQVELRTHRRPGGTGLGLPFCKMTVEAHGGTIGTRPVDKGSEFYFTIPKSG